MKFSAKIDRRITSWMAKTRETYLHHDAQNATIRLLVFIILRDIEKNINDSILYWTMAYETTDCSDKESFVISFRWGDKAFDTYEDVIEIYNVTNIKTDTLVTVIQKTF